MKKKKKFTRKEKNWMGAIMVLYILYNAPKLVSWESYKMLNCILLDQKIFD